MSTTMTAPEAMNRRGEVAILLQSLPNRPVPELTVTFREDSYPTTSYIDEFVRQALHEGAVQRMVFLHADEYIVELASAAADRYGVADRLSFG